MDAGGLEPGMEAFVRLAAAWESSWVSVTACFLKSRGMTKSMVVFPDAVYQDKDYLTCSRGSQEEDQFCLRQISEKDMLA